MTPRNTALPSAASSASSAARRLLLSRGVNATQDARCTHAPVALVCFSSATFAEQRVQVAGGIHAHRSGVDQAVLRGLFGDRSARGAVRS
jgi:hypothetical protein